MNHLTEPGTIFVDKVSSGRSSPGQKLSIQKINGSGIKKRP